MTALSKGIVLGGVLLYAMICHALPAPSKADFLVISDIHLNATSTHTMNFSPRMPSLLNDLDVATYRKLIHKLSMDIQAGLVAKPEFILLLGDLVGHIRYSSADVITSETIVFETLRQEFPDTPILYDFGNNDSLLKDYGPFRTTLPGTSLRSPVDVMKTVWPQADFLSSGVQCARQLHTYPCLIHTKKTSGYYSAYLNKHVRLIALNSVMFSDQSIESDKEITTQLAWLKQELISVERNRESALIVMHVPPGYNLYRPWFWSDTAFWTDLSYDTFMGHINAHHSSVIGILAAHTHKDELKIMLDHAKNPVVGVYLNPALSTSHGNAPSVRSYQLGQDLKLHWSLTNYQTYYFKQKADEMTLNLLYDFRETYCHPFEYKMTDCLENVSLEKMQLYYSAGNSKFFEKINVPGNIYFQR